MTQLQFNAEIYLLNHWHIKFSMHYFEERAG